jgi:uncharacterized membrane protein
MLSIKSWYDASGAMLLFTTNFFSIMVMGIVTLYVFGLHKQAKQHNAKRTGFIFLVCLVTLGLIAVPLYYTSQRLAIEADAKACLEDYADEKAVTVGWQVQIVLATSSQGRLSATVSLLGPLPFPTDLIDISAEGIAQACPMVDAIQISYIPTKFIDLTEF